MKRALFFLAAVLVMAPSPVTTVAVDQERLNRIPKRMKAYEEHGDVAGVVNLVQQHGKIVLLEATGYQDIEKQIPMKTDTICQIMSMTKPFTGVGIMILMEEGRLSLNDPVSNYLPAFKEQMVSADPSNPKAPLHKPARPITIRDLMTHTSGMWGPAPSDHLYQTMDRSLKDAVDGFARMPLAFEPGAKWQYSNPGIATLGRIIEVVTGEHYEKFIEQELLTPLGMKDSFFFPPEEKKSRIAMVYDTKGDKLVRGGAELLGGDPAKFRKGAIYPAPEFGLYSTAEDLSHFYQMMLNNGVYNGRRYLSKTSVDIMTTVQTGDIHPAGWLPGGAYGLTWEVIKDPIGTMTLLSRGTYGHGGAFGTHGWIDRDKDLVGVFMVQGGNTDTVKNAVFQMTGAAVTE